MPEGQSILLSALPPTQGQKRVAAAVAVLLLGALLVTIPFMQVQLPAVRPFIPVVDTVLFLNDLITAALLFAQFSVTRSRALLALACGYLFTALIIVPHALTFPDVFSPTGLLGANLQSTVWLYIFWHLGLPPAVIAYALLKGRPRPTTAPIRPARGTIVCSAIAIVVLACALTWLVTAGVAILPDIMVDARHASSVWHTFGAPPLLALSVVSIGLLWWRRSSVLDLWLLVVLWAWFIETLLLSTTAYRYSLVWYAGRAYGLLSSFFVLLVLLSESTMLYARLAVSVLAQRREREGRLMSMEALTAAIEHEIRQPLGAIVARANAGRRWLGRAPPDLEEARMAFDAIANDGHRSSEVIHSMRSMFGKDEEYDTALDANDLIQETLALVRGELQNMRIAVDLELAPQLPRVSAHRVPLQQVILNLVTNAADAMRTLTDRAAVLRVKSRPSESNGVEVTIADSGPGIDPNIIDRIFDAFFTTKSGGMGMGLAICRSIVQAHGGTLSVSPGVPDGAVFQIVLPGSG